MILPRSRYVELEEYDLYKVLIVDDDDITLCRLRKFRDWETNGFAINDEAHDGIKALEKLTSKFFDLIITDIRMPGMDGLNLLKEIKARNIDSCLIIMSTYNDFEYAQQGIRLGIFDYLVKPVGDNTLCEVLERIKRHLDEKKLYRDSRLEENKRQIEDSLTYYYPKKQEKKLIDLMLIGSDEVINEAVSTCLELAKFANQDLFKTSLMLEKILLNLREEIYTVFPWLETLKKVNFEDVFNNITSITEIKLRFLSCIEVMLEMIKKYEMHHPDCVVGQTCRYVINHVEEDIKLDDIGNAIHISRDYIGKLFKQKTGCNFSDYVTKVKMEHAKYLLGTGQYKNYEICDKLGYSRPDYFSRLFKDYTGYTPLEFRKLGIHDFNKLERTMLDQECSKSKIIYLNDKNILEFFQMRMDIEPLVLECVIERLSFPKIELINELFMEQMKYYDLLDANAFIKIDQNFHRYLALLSGNQQLIQAINNQSEMMHQLGVQAVAHITRYQEVLEEHTEIIKALKSHNLVKARAAMQYHVLQTQEAVKKHLVTAHFTK